MYATSGILSLLNIICSMNLAMHVALPQVRLIPLLSKGNVSAAVLIMDVNDCTMGCVDY